MSAKVPITVRIDPKLADALRDAAVATHSTVAEVFEEALKAWLAKRAPFPKRKKKAVKRGRPIQS